jgi:hypothetical protein
MKKSEFKKLIVSLISLLLVFSLTACGTYKPPVDPDNPDDPGVTPGPVGPSGPGETRNTFTVTLMYNGMTFIPESTDVKAQWTDGYNYYQQDFDSYGTASVTGLDGEYRVTLTEVPDGYGYDANAYTTSNDNKDIVIEIFKLSKVTGKGTQNNPYQMTSIGVYETSITGSNGYVYYKFAPKTEGEYSIESWMDVTANEYNPRVDVYNANAGGWMQLREEVDGGGASSGYTQNFLFKVQVSEDMIGNIFIFAIKVESKNDDYPVRVCFALKRDGHFELDHIVSDMILPKEIDTALNYLNSADAKENEKGKVMYPVRYENGKRILDGDSWGYNEDTGFYQKYNPASGKYDGEILYAQITSNTVFLDRGLNTMQDAGNKCLTIANGTENYHFFIEGSEMTNEDPRFNIYKGLLGYTDIVNKDGNVPVTQEVKDFLQKFAISQLYFRDGDGWCEVGGYTGSREWMTDSFENDQWLWACVYYA